MQIAFSVASDRVNHQGISIGSALWVLEISVVYTDTISMKPITARYGGWLSE